jgi:hypothetical protein
MSSPDPLAIAIDWLDAYRDRALSRLLELHDDEAVTECQCNSQAIIVGKVALAHYWKDRFEAKPALELEDIALDGTSVRLSYRTFDGLVSALLDMDASGKIIRTRCGPIRAVASACVSNA